MITLKQIVDFLSLPSIDDSEYIGVSKALSIDDVNFDKSAIGWCSDKNLGKLKSLTAGNVLISPVGKDLINFDTKQINLLVVENPRRSFAHLLNDFFTEEVIYGNIDPSARVHETTQFNSNEVVIGCNVVIEKGCIVGNKVSIGHNSVIKCGTIIGENVSIGSNCTVGGVGFGYEMNEDGSYEVIPHIGNVHLDDFVEIGNNVCIDKAVMGSTYLAKNVKVDNLVHIAHGVEIGENSLVIAHAMIAGSVKIGKNVWVAPSSSVRQKLIIGDNALIGLGSVVIRDVKDSETVVGVPAKPFAKK